MALKPMISYRMILLIGVLSKNKEGMSVRDLQTRLETDRLVTVYKLLQDLQHAEMVEKVVQMEKRMDGRPPNNFKLTEKGHRYANSYNFAALADNPPFVTVEDFE